MPGPSDNGGPWGELPLVVDTSAWSRAGRPEIREDWQKAVNADRLRISPAARLEILRTPRSGAHSTNSLRSSPRCGRRP